MKRLDTEGTSFDAPYMGATEAMPKGEVRVVTSCWRGDTFYYEGSTHYEYPGGFCPEEMSSVIYGNKIILISAPAH